tara:strand:+ start:1865 stop:2632 length:768 start_codon:yes stop_codon:yes gene_type:complete
MLKILEKIGKNIYKEDHSVKKKAKPKRKRRKAKKNKKELSDKFFQSIIAEIERNGSRTIRVTTMMKKLGIGKRSDNSVNFFRRELKEHGLYSLPIFSKELPLNSLVKLYSFPVKQLGDLFKKEVELENYIDTKELYKQLEIETVDRQYSPNKTRDRLDFKGISENESVVLELKNRGGGKSAVEQVLRYSGLLKAEDPNQKIRKILVTGIQNYETALAIKGMKSDERDNFEWYLYKYFKVHDTFEFVRVKIDEIEC